MVQASCKCLYMLLNKLCQILLEVANTLWQTPPSDKYVLFAKVANTLGKICQRICSGRDVQQRVDRGSMQWF
jgi:hypothetical protein